MDHNWKWIWKKNLYLIQNKRNWLFFTLFMNIHDRIDLMKGFKEKNQMKKKSKKKIVSDVVWEFLVVIFVVLLSHLLKRIERKILSGVN